MSTFPDNAPAPVLPAGDPREEIARLEGEIEDLAQDIERCRKVMLVAKIASAAAAFALFAMAFALVRFTPAAMIVAMAVALGGTVVFGSNASTLKERAGRLKTAEAMRAELIGRIDLRVVGPADV